MGEAVAESAGVRGRPGTRGRLGTRERLGTRDRLGVRERLGIRGRLSALDRKRVAIVAGLVLAALTFDFFVTIRHGFFDLNVYHGAIGYWTHGGDIYDFLLAESTYGFTYPPFAALVMLPMAIVPWGLTIALYCVVCLAAAGVLVWWLAGPIARRLGWPHWFAAGLVMGFTLAFEPFRETYLFGQVNIFLVLLVGLDLLYLSAHPRRRHLTGIGIGLATAIKLTPGIFILYLLVTRQWRAAAVASGVAGGATVLAAAIVPGASRTFWTDMVWNTDRIGVLSYISNQSLQGAVARLHPGYPGTMLWGAAALAVLALWFFRVRRAGAAGDQATGFALTGIVGVLISPITWVHHLVWVLPAVVLLGARALESAGRRRWWRWGLLAFCYLVLSSRIVWSYDKSASVSGWILGNSYVWISILLLAALPIAFARPTPPTEPAAPQSQPPEPVAVEPAVAQAAPEPAEAPLAAERALTEEELSREFVGLLVGEHSPNPR